MKHILLSMLAVSAVFVTSSCENGDKEFGDYDYQTVYFANQTPLRTITLGDDVYPTELDNAHDIEVYAALGGVEKNKSDRNLTVAVDESLVAGKTFEDGRPVLALPSNYYKLESNQITIPSGKVMGCVKVHLEDAFFNDPKAASLNYVLPLKIVTAGDSILEKKNYVLYGIKYKNPYTGCWLRHGTDVNNDNGVSTTVTDEPAAVEKYSLRYLSTKSLTQCVYPITATVSRKYADGEKKDVLTGNVIFTIDDEGNCTVTSEGNGADFEFTASGTGKWTHEGAKKAWNDKDRDLLDLDYTVTFKYAYNTVDNTEQRTYTITSKESLIMRDRQSKFETFNVK